MAENQKLRDGFCTISLVEYGPPLIAYRKDENGEPIINEDEILILKMGKIIYGEGDDQNSRAQLGLNGRSYEFVRAELLRNHKKCKLSEENCEKLRSIVSKKMRRFSKNEGVNLEIKVEVE